MIGIITLIRIIRIINYYYCRPSSADHRMDGDDMTYADNTVLFTEQEMESLSITMVISPK